MSSGKIVIEIDGKALLAAQDGPAFVKAQALQEIRLQSHYDEHEMEFVEKDETFIESCEKAYLKVRDAASGREWKDAKVADKGETPTHAPFRWKIGIHYERPGTRGWLDREMRE
jgi:hypothetical protein